MRRRFFTEDEAQEMRDAIDRVESALTEWDLPNRRRLWEAGEPNLEIQIRVRLSCLRSLANAYDKLNEIMNRGT